jgi:pyridoxal phosphate-dependent aminotransferase EpsN
LSCFTIDEAKFGGNRNELIQYLDASNIDSRPVWKPMHSQPLFKGYESIGGDVSDRLNQTGICLPSSNCLTEEEQEFVIDHVVKFHQTNKTQTSSNK